MTRAAVIVSVLVLLLVSVIPIGRTVAESFLERGPDGAAHFTLKRYDEAFVSGPPRAATSETTTLETPATRPVATRWKLLGNSVAIAFGAAVVALALGVPF